MMSGNLTADQRRRIEENKQKALAKRAVKSHQASTNQIASSVSAPVNCLAKTENVLTNCLPGRQHGHEAKALSGTTSSFNKPQGRVASASDAESDSNKTTTGPVYDLNKCSHHRLQEISTIGLTGGLNKSLGGLTDPAVGCSTTLGGLTSSIGPSRGLIKTKDSCSTSSHTRTDGGHTGTHGSHIGTHVRHTGTHNLHTGTHDGHTGSHCVNTGTHSVHTGIHSGHTETHGGHTGTHDVNTGTRNVYTGTHSLHTGTHGGLETGKVNIGQPVKATLPKSSEPVYSNIASGGRSISGVSVNSHSIKLPNNSSMGTVSASSAKLQCTSLVVPPSPTGLAGSSSSGEGWLSSRAVSSTTKVQSAEAKSNIDYDKIEQNRLQALAKRADKLSKSPMKGVSQLSHPVSGFSHSDTNSSLHFSHKSPTNLHCSSNPGTVKNESSSTSQNIFSGFSGTPVKGGCFLVSRDRFEVKVGYSAPLVQMFKAMQTKLYDAVTKKWSFRLSEYNSFMMAVRNLKPAVDIEPLPRAIVTTFSGQISGDNPVSHVPMADLSRVEQYLVNSLMSFQREGVKLVHLPCVFTHKSKGDF